MRWKASASDIGEDSYNDNMSVDLYNDFINRINTQELAPEQFRSYFWSGGTPYLSISHYPDLDGKAVPGSVETVYIDGDCNKACLKSKGKFSDSKIGKAAFEAVKDNPNQPEDKKVRVSIGFLDWAHVHKSNNFRFDRTDVDDICTECLKEMLKGKSKGKIYLAGQLVHLALTRVPANKRTEMEVDKSMTTRKEDAESIIGEELAEELEKGAELIGKSEALVIKAEDEVEVEKAKVEDKKPEDDEEDEDMEEEKCSGKKKKVSKAEVLFSEIKSELAEIKSLIVPVPVEVHEHILDASIGKLKSDFDNAVTVSNLSTEDRLKLMQPAFNELGEVVKEKVSISALPVQETVQTDVQTEQPDMVKAFSEALQPLQQQLGLLSAQMAELKKAPQVSTVPTRISLPPQLVQQKSVVVKSETPNLRAMIERTT